MGTFPAALLAGLGLDVAGRRASGSAPLRLVVGVVAVGFALALLGGPPARWAGIGMVGALAALLVAPGARAVRPLAWALVVLVAAERVLATRNTVMLTENLPATFFAAPPAVAFLRDHAGSERVLVVKDWKRRFPYMEKAGELWGFHVAQDYEPLVVAAYRKVYGPLGGAIVGPLFTGRVQPGPEDPGWRMLDLLAVRYVVVARNVPWVPRGAARFRPVYVGGDATIYENVKSVPRVFLAGRWRVVADRADALQAVVGPGFDPRADVVVDGAAPPEPPAAGAAGEARIVAEGNERVVVDVESPAGGLVVLGDLDWPGWHATVDGEPRPIVRANFLFRAVAVGPGVHEVVFGYTATRVTVGALVSLATLVGVVALGPLDRRRRAPTVGPA
jgi:hypothetical protein